MQLCKWIKLKMVYFAIQDAGLLRQDEMFQSYGFYILNVVV